MPPGRRLAGTPGCGGSQPLFRGLQVVYMVSFVPGNYLFLPMFVPGNNISVPCLFKVTIFWCTGLLKFNVLYNTVKGSTFINTRIRNS